MPERNGQAVPLRNKFGTFGGVFTPSILTILGVIMFMRANFVVGHAGIFHAVIILVIAKSITFLTGLSASAVGTNMRVKGGGAYYLISRVLGPEFGGSIGMALFCALALSVPFYILGFTEALVRSFPAMERHFSLLTFVSAALLFVIAYVGAGWAIKTQYFIMAFLLLAIIAFTGGQIANFSAERFAANWGPATAEMLPKGVPVLSFWVLFAIYFPAVTGIDAGINMSGDLDDPARSIPRGTMSAVTVGFLVYLSQMLLGGGAYQRYAPGAQNMIDTPYQLLRDNALFGLGILVVLGVFAATLSSALGSYLGAPRVLQAVSRDGILPALRFFAKGSAGKDEPRRALVFTGLVTVGVLTFAMFSGGSEGAALNAVAAVITMFFLCSYGMINAAAFVEGVGDNPSFRPRFRFFHWALAGLGALGCAVTMLLINPVAAVIAILTISGLYWYVRRQHLASHFGDARRGWVFSTAMRNLETLAGMDEDEKNWRPTPLVLVGNPASREVLVRYAVWLESGHGIMLLANVLVGSIEDHAAHRRAALKKLSELCEERELRAFPMVVVAENHDQGIQSLLQTASVGPIRPNLLIMGWSEEQGRVDAYWRNLRVAAALEMGLVLVVDRGLPSESAEPARRIDVWWRGQKNGALMLLLAHLMSSNREWAGTEIRLLRKVESPEGGAPAEEALAELARDARMTVRPEVIVSEKRFPEVLREQSAGAACVFLGFEMPEPGREGMLHSSLMGMLEGLPTTVLINSRGGEDVTA